MDADVQILPDTVPLLRAAMEDRTIKIGGTQTCQKFLSAYWGLLQRTVPAG